MGSAIKSISLGLVILTLIFFSCDKEVRVEEDVEDDLVPPLVVNSDSSYNMEKLLTNLTWNYILPAYANFSESVSSLETASLTFLSEASEANLASYQSAWENCLLSWQEVAFLEYGAAEDLYLRAQTNIYPADTEQIHQNIQNGGYDLTSVHNLDAKGIQALDYLLFSKSDPQEAVVFLSNKSVSDYMTNVIIDLKSNIKYVEDNWSGYASDFIADSKSDGSDGSIHLVVTKLIKHYESYIRTGKLGIPSGIFNSPSKQPLPDHVEAFYAQKSLAALTRSMESFEQYFNGVSYLNGTNGEGLDDYLDFLCARKDGELLSEVIQNQISKIKDALRILKVPLSKEVTANNEQVNKTYQELQKLVILLKIDMTYATQIWIEYFESD